MLPSHLLCTAMSLLLLPGRYTTLLLHFHIRSTRSLLTCQLHCSSSPVFRSLHKIKLSQTPQPLYNSDHILRPSHTTRYFFPYLSGLFRYILLLPSHLLCTAMSLLLLPGRYTTLLLHFHIRSTRSLLTCQLHCSSSPVFRSLHKIKLSQTPQPLYNSDHILRPSHTTRYFFLYLSGLFRYILLLPSHLLCTAMSLLLLPGRYTTLLLHFHIRSTRSLLTCQLHCSSSPVFRSLHKIKLSQTPQPLYNSDHILRPSHTTRYFFPYLSGLFRYILLLAFHF